MTSDVAYIPCDTWEEPEDVNRNTTKGVSGKGEKDMMQDISETARSSHKGSILTNQRGSKKLRYQTKKANEP